MSSRRPVCSPSSARCASSRSSTRATRSSTPQAIDAQWRGLELHRRPDIGRAVDEHDGSSQILRGAGAVALAAAGPADRRSTRSTRATPRSSAPRGMILCRMGKPLRAGEPAAQERGVRGAGAVAADRRPHRRRPAASRAATSSGSTTATVAVGRGYRTNAEGIRQFRALLGDARRGRRGAAAALARRRRRDAPDVAHQPGRSRPGGRLLAAAAGAVPRVAARPRRTAWSRCRTRSSTRMATNVLALAPRPCLMLRRQSADARARSNAPAPRSSSTRAARSASKAPAARPA